MILKNPSVQLLFFHSTIENEQELYMKKKKKIPLT